MKDSDVPHYVIDAVIRRNDTIDRSEKDWMDDIGRAFEPK
jgi:hypothetical protein